jgi:hypothetical protein
VTETGRRVIRFPHAAANMTHETSWTKRQRGKIGAIVRADLPLRRNSSLRCRRRTLEIAIEWGRYGEVYEYDFNAGVLKLSDETSEETGAT